MGMIISIIFIIVGASMILYGCYILCLLLICRSLDNKYLFTEEQVLRLRALVDNVEFDGSNYLKMIKYANEYGVLDPNR